MKRDKEMVIFKTKEGDVTYGDIVNALIVIGADDCDVLFIHTEISFGIPKIGMKRKELYEVIWDAIQESNVETYIFPTFTFSFCNNEIFDVRNSVTKMGVFNEYIRKNPDAERTCDPLLSVCVIGKKEPFLSLDSKNSIGDGGIYNKIKHTDKKVKFLFFGTDVMSCFTYLHYVEEQKKVPYRYNRTFSGIIIDKDGRNYHDSYNLYVRYKGVKAILPVEFKDMLIENNILKEAQLGQSAVSCVVADKSYELIEDLIEKDNYVFSSIKEKDTGKISKDFEFGNVFTL